MSDKPLPQIDYTRVHFPSDSVTIGKLRAVNPLRLDVDEPRLIDVVGMLTVERSLARQAFDATLSRVIPDENDYLSGRNALVGDLASNYKTYGLARGPKTAMQLIKAFEAEAAAQACEHLGKNR
jgi:hypothetical protein